MARRWMLAGVCALLLVAGLTQGCKKPVSKVQPVSTKLVPIAEVRPVGSTPHTPWTLLSETPGPNEVPEGYEVRLSRANAERAPGGGMVVFGDTELAQLAQDFAGTNVTWLMLSGQATISGVGTKGNEGVTDAGLVHLAKFPNLEYLDLSMTPVTDAGLVCLADLTKLQTLDLSLCLGVTDAGLVHLAKLVSLKTLDLDGPGVTDAGLEHLAKLTNLTELSLNGCKGVTTAGEDALHAKLPGCKIER